MLNNGCCAFLYLDSNLKPCYPNCQVSETAVAWRCVYMQACASALVTGVQAYQTVHESDFHRPWFSKVLLNHCVWSKPEWVILATHGPPDRLGARRPTQVASGRFYHMRKLDPSSLPEGFTWTFPFQVKFTSSVFVFLFLPKELEWLQRFFCTAVLKWSERGAKWWSQKDQGRLAGSLASIWFCPFGGSDVQIPHSLYLSWYAFKLRSWVILPLKR